MTRRRFLIGAGAVAGASLLPAAWSALRSAPFFTRPLSLKAGLLIPQAGSYPALAERINAGLQAAHHPALEALSLVPAAIDVGYGAAAQQSQKLLTEGEVDLVIAFVNSQVADRLRPIFESQRRPLIVLDSGANVVRPAQRSPYVFYNSLGHWQAGYAAAHHLVEQHGPRVFIATGLFDSGYDSLNAVQQGVRAAGGEVVDTFVTHIDPRRPGVADAIEAIRSARPDSVYALYAGAPAADFVQAYLDAGLGSTLPLAGSGFLIEGSAQDALGERAAGIATTLGWAADPTHPVEVARDDSFATLGYDTVQFIGAAVQAAGEPHHWGEQDLALTVTGARNGLTFDPTDQSLTGPIFAREARPVHGTLANLAVETLPLTPAPTVPETAAGWLNPYLCG
ncbi:MAG: ABC transporter substrate-binding protein [Anaerolineales bacterium]|nr:ABC transporter substrate-binding protein [Anaerolineales bacterium]